RIGIVTRKYLFTEYKNISKTEIRVSSIKESIKVLPIVVKDVMNYFPNKIASLFKKTKLTPEEEEIFSSI
ncbi:MAG TPA: hypothetical protein GX740_02575, partial [Acholeplasmataceae bacterium]|nr:hypothetical protein [Acholeplasmataceae bacterium]